MQFHVADAHCDYLFGAMDYGWTIDTQKRNQTITLENLKKGGVALQFLAAWADTKLRVPPLEQVLIMIDRYHSMLETHPEFVKLSKDFDPASGKIATVLAVEGAGANKKASVKFDTEGTKMLMLKFAKLSILRE